MIYISSDWHLTKDSIGEFEKRLSRLGGDDLVLLLGDLANDWTLVEGRPWFAAGLEKNLCRIVMIDGNHEDFHYLDGLPEAELFGARGDWVADNLFHVRRGEVLRLEGLTFLTVGGGYSGEGYIHRHPDTWQAREMPDGAELRRVRESCEACGYAFDYVLSHAAPLSVIQKYGLGDETNELHLFLEELRGKLTWKKWFFGHYHKEVVYEDGFEMVYHRLRPLAAGRPAERRTYDD